MRFSFWPLHKGFSRASGLCLFCCTLFSLSPPSLLGKTPSASPDPNSAQGIAAIVNKSVLTQQDVADRVKLLQISTPETLSPEQLKKLRETVIKNMIDELLQIEEATARDITVEESEVQEAINRIEADNGMSPGQLPAYLQEKEVPFSTLRDQIYANLLWARYIGEAYRDIAPVPDHELDEVYERMLDHETIASLHAYEIVLPIEDPSEREKVLSQAKDIIQHVQNGSSFSKLARQFSQASSAAKGGDLGWISPTHYDEVSLNEALLKLSLQRISPPIETPKAIYLFWVSEKKAENKAADVLLDIAEVSISLFLDRSPEAYEAAKSQLEKLRSQVSSCSDLTPLTEKVGASVIFTQNVILSKLPSELKALLDGLSENQSSLIFMTDHGPSFVLVCKKHEYQGSSQDFPTKEKLREGMRNQKLDLIARRVLKDLRRRALIDIRS